MARLYGREWTKDEVRRRVGDLSQVADARRVALRGGKAEGVEAVEVTTGSGFAFTVLPSRGMDVAWASYKGQAVGWISKTGVASPAYFREDGVRGFLDGFFGGLVTTCGYTHMGAPSVDEGRALGLHGPASNLPAEDVAVTREWVGDEYVLSVRGRMRQASVFGENVVLTRSISASLGGTSLRICDRVENAGYASQPLMFLYHLNFGWPVVDAATRLHVRTSSVMPRDAEASLGLSAFDRFQEPTSGYAEQVFHLDPAADANGLAHAVLFNPALGADGFGVHVAYGKETLPHFTEWKMMGEQEYVVGLEPGTWRVAGRAEARRLGELDFLQPGEFRDFVVEIGVVEGRAALQSLLG